VNSGKVNSGKVNSGKVNSGIFNTSPAHASLWGALVKSKGEKATQSNYVFEQSTNDTETERTIFNLHNIDGIRHEENCMYA